MKQTFLKQQTLLATITLATILASATTVLADSRNFHANNRPVVHERHEIEHRQVNYQPERHHAYFWSRFSIGSTIAVLPQGYVQVSTGAVGYYYYDGVFYQPTTFGNYVAVAPGTGAVIPQLPDGAEVFNAGPTTYFYAGGNFYMQQVNGFAVVPAPLGITVTTLPSGAAPVVINGMLYYQAPNGFYQPVAQGGITVYVTAQP